MRMESVIAQQTIDQAGPTRKVRLSRILHGIVAVKPADDRSIGRLQLHSRRVRRGDVFVALPGLTSDGRDYIPQAVERQAAAVIYDSAGIGRMQASEGSTLLVAVDDLKGKLGRIVSAWFQNPSAALQVIGVTGTNGKTTTAYLVGQALQRLGLPCGYTGTLGTGEIGNLQKSDLTTMDVISTHRRLADFRSMGMAAVSLEVSSHGLDQGRVNGVEFDIAILTNLSRDHLDYHRSMDQYGQAKQKLFEFPSLRIAVINADDVFGQNLVSHLQKHRADLTCLTYGLGDADLSPCDVAVSADGIEFDLSHQGESRRIRSGLTGEFNVFNMLATVAALLGLGYGIGEIADVMPELSSPPGRMEMFSRQSGQPGVVVDYAHTPDALEQALNSLKSLGCGKLVVVFGCGGDRDQEKRPQMGAIAERLADRVILTDDNPRSESPELIVRQIVQGMKDRPTVIHDRKLATWEAIRSSAAGDLILLAGKGHETEQITGHQTRQLSDRQLVRELLEQLS